MILHKCATIDTLHCETAPYDGIEIQLLQNSECKPEDFFQENVFSVHSLLDTSAGYDVDIADMTDYTLDNIYRAFKFADEIGKFQGKQIGVVLHTSLGYSGYVKYNLIKDVSFRLGSALNTYQNTFVLIENSTEHTFDGEDTARVAVEIKNSVNPVIGNRIFSVLDTTHAWITSKRLGILYNQNEDKYFEEYFKAYAESGLCKEIHFANCIDWGNSFDTHGVDFRDGVDDEFFNKICQLIHKYLPDTVLCIEVREEDYHKPMAYSHIYNKLRRWVPK